MPALLNPLGNQPRLRELKVSTTAWLLGVSTRVVRKHFDWFEMPDGTPGARRSGGHWVIDAEAEEAEVRLTMLDRVIDRMVTSPRMPKNGPGPPLSAAVFSWSVGTDSVPVWRHSS
jgi:hypothetical protein